VPRSPSGTIYSGKGRLSPAEAGWGLTVGNFDGVHVGHRKIIEQLCGLVRPQGLLAVAVTFDPHPATLLRPQGPPPPLTRINRRIEMLLGLGLDAVVVIDTTPALLQYSAETFYLEVLCGCLHAKAFVEGEDFRFGAERQGDIQQLQAWAMRDGLGFAAVPAVQQGDQPVSSSRVRQLITAGAVAEASKLLGAAYEISGTVVTGQQRGAGLGFPTANLHGIGTLLPADGVYAGVATTATGQRYAAAIHVGKNLTFGATAATVEVHLIGFTGDLYGQRLAVSFGEQLRQTQQFAGVEALVTQLQKDVAEASSATVEMIKTLPQERVSFTISRFSG
jgi:riboflavin kinase/FMN adenylyltransferase